AAARAYGDERRNRLGRRAHQLAFQLERGVPLDQAIERSKIRLPTEVLVALRTAYAGAGMGPVVAAAADRDASLERVSNQLSSRLMYLVVFLLAAAGIITFVFIKIVPAYIQIFSDFGSDLPAS